MKELILYTANVGGGVHHGKPRDKDNAKVIHADAAKILIEGNPYQLLL